jgi:hypothetical protein
MKNTKNVLAPLTGSELDTLHLMLRDAWDDLPLAAVGTRGDERLAYMLIEQENEQLRMEIRELLGFRN